MIPVQHAMSNNHSSRKKLCTDHPQQDLDYCCFDPDCLKKTLACVICLKNNHQGCKACFILMASDIAERVEIFRHETPSVNRKNFVNQIKGLMQLLIGHLLIITHRERDRIVTDTETKVIYPEYRLTTDSLKSHRDDLSIEFNPQTFKVEVKHKGINSLEKIKKSVWAFETKVARVLDELMVQVRSLRVLGKRQLRLSDWATNINLSTTENADGSLTITRMEKSLSFGKVCIAVTVAPVSFCDFEIEVLANGKSSKLVEVGFFDQEAFGLVKDSLDIRSPIGKIVYYNGLTKSASLTGKEPFGAIGFDVNTSITVEFKGSVVRLYNKESGLDLESTFVSSQSYFYCSLEDEGISIRIHYYA